MSSISLLYFFTGCVADFWVLFRTICVHSLFCSWTERLFSNDCCSRHKVLTDFSVSTFNDDVRDVTDAWVRSSTMLRNRAAGTLVSLALFLDRDWTIKTHVHRWALIADSVREFAVVAAAACLSCLCRRLLTDNNNSQTTWKMLANKSVFVLNTISSLCSLYTGDNSLLWSCLQKTTAVVEQGRTWVFVAFIVHHIISPRSIEYANATVINSNFW